MPLSSAPPLCTDPLLVVLQYTMPLCCADDQYKPPNPPILIPSSPPLRGEVGGEGGVVSATIGSYYMIPPCNLAVHLVVETPQYIDNVGGHHPHI